MDKGIGDGRRKNRPGLTPGEAPLAEAVGAGAGDALGDESGVSRGVVEGDVEEVGGLDVDGAPGGEHALDAPMRCARYGRRPPARGRRGDGAGVVEIDGPMVADSLGAELGDFEEIEGAVQPKGQSAAVGFGLPFEKEVEVIAGGGFEMVEERQATHGGW